MKILLALLVAFSLFAQSWSVVYRSQKLHLKKSDLKYIYFKKMRQKNGISITALNLPSSHPARKAFLKQILDSDLHHWDIYYDQMYFMGVKTPPVLNSSEAMIKFLHKIDGAIGYIPSKEVSGSLIELARFEF